MDFIADSRELLDDVEPQLISLWESCRENPHDMDTDRLNQIFRLFHSLKGSAGFLNLNHLVELAHAAETLLSDCRESLLQLKTDHINLLCQSVDLIRAILYDLEGGAGEEPHAETCQSMISSLQQIRKHSKTTEEAQSISDQPDSSDDSRPTGRSGIVITEEMIHSFVAETDDSLRQIEASLLILAQLEDEDSLNESFRHFHSIKGNAGFLGYSDAASMAHEAEETLEKALEAGQTLPEAACDTLLEIVDVLRQSLADIQQGGSGQIDNLQDSLQRIKTCKRSQPETPPQTAPAKPVPEPPPKPDNESRNRAVERRDIRVDLEKLDTLINLVGELVIAESMVINNPDLQGLELENFEKASQQLSKISRDLQEVALAIRMVPLAATFKKMVRLVHDLALKTEKKVELQVRGEETEIDKTLVESISDPLVHMIRNCADHGIESPAERLAASKPEFGTIRLEARHEEGEVYIIVSDDGRGLDPHHIRSKAIEKGLIQATDDLSERDILQLIFEPGFSTAVSLSDISGRGVGLDVLKRNMEKLKGSVHVRSKPGVGCTFTMRIPLTLAIIEGMLIQCGSRHYTVPLLSIRESLKLHEELVTHSIDGSEMIHLRGEILPIVRLHQLHSIGDAHTDLLRGVVIILESSSGTFGLLVDKILGQQQTVIKPLSSYIGQLKGVSGCTIMGNGEISLILDINTLVQEQDMDVEPSMDAASV